MITTLPFIFIGDAAFPLKPYMLRPYPGRYLEEVKQIFNYPLSRAHHFIENTFGIMAARFRIFRQAIIAHPDKVTKITKAASVLHNYLKISDIRSLSSSLRQHCPPGYVDHEDPLGNLIPGVWRSESGQSAILTIYCFSCREQLFLSFCCLQERHFQGIFCVSLR